MVWVIVVIVGLIVGLSASASTNYYKGILAIFALLGSILAFWLFYYVAGFRVFSFFFEGGIYLDAILWSLLGSLVLLLVARLFVPDEEYVGRSRGVMAHEYREPSRRRVKHIEEEETDDDDTL